MFIERLAQDLLQLLWNSMDQLCFNMEDEEANILLQEYCNPFMIMRMQKENSLIIKTDYPDMQSYFFKSR